MARTPPRPPKGTRFGGRAKGTPNQATANARDAIARLVDGNGERVQGWLDEIANGCLELEYSLVVFGTQNTGELCDADLGAAN